MNLADAQTNTVSITVASNPTGPNFVLVDGIAISTPHVFNWAVSSNHTLQAAGVVFDPNSNATRYIFNGRWSDGGIETHVYTVPSSSETVVANYTTQYFVVFYVNPLGAGMVSYTGGNFFVPSGTGIWINAGSSKDMMDYDSPGFLFSSWSATGSISLLYPDMFGTMATVNGPGTIIDNIRDNSGTGYPPGVSIWTNTNDYAGFMLLSSDALIVDGSPALDFASYDWAAGSTHTLEARSIVTSSTPTTRFVFIGWSDGGAQNHTFTVKSGALPPAFAPPGNYICAFYKTQYLITFNQTGLDSSAMGTVLTVNGQSKVYSDLPFSEWVDSGEVTVTSNGAMVDYSFSPTVSSNTSGKQFSFDYGFYFPGELRLTIDSPMFPWLPLEVWNYTVTGSYKSIVSTLSVMVTSSVTGVSSVIVDGITMTTPANFSWAVGSTHSLQALSPINGPAGTRHVWTSWSNGGAQSHNGTVWGSGSVTVVATYKTQYYLTIDNGGFGTASGQGWYDAGSDANFQISPTTVSAGFLTYNVFSKWSGDYTGKENPMSITMNSPKSITAQWVTDPSQLYMFLAIFMIPVIIILVALAARSRRRRPKFLL